MGAPEISVLPADRTVLATPARTPPIVWWCPILELVTVAAVDDYAREMHEHLLHSVRSLWNGVTALSKTPGHWCVSKGIRGEVDNLRSKRMNVLISKSDYTLDASPRVTNLGIALI